jgi:hypothetical protein
MAIMQVSYVWWITKHLKGVVNGNYDGVCSCFLLSFTVNTENEQINTFIYDDVVGGKMGGAYLISYWKTR